LRRFSCYIANSLDALADNLATTASRALANKTEDIMDPHIAADEAVEDTSIVVEDVGHSPDAFVKEG
jgi:hypothetical protein